MTLTKTILEYESLIASSMSSFGLRAVDSSVYSYVYCSLKEVSLDNIAKHTGYSLATISTVVKHLSDVHVLERIKKPGTKKVFVGVDRNMLKLMETKISSILKYLVLPKKESVPVLIKNLKLELKTVKNTAHKSEIKNYLNFLSSELNETLILENVHNHLLNFIKKVNVDKNK